LAAEDPVPVRVSPEAQAGRPRRVEPDPWVPQAFPKEILVVVALLVARAAFFGWVVLTSRGAGETLLSFMLLDVLMVIGLLRRSLWGIWLSILFLSVRAIASLGLLMMLPMGSPRGAPSIAPVMTFLILGGGSDLLGVVLLLVSRFSGRYLPKETRPRPARRAPGGRESCARCGVSFVPYDSEWNRGGFCSRKCLESGGAARAR
jgi:hypothetical protein